MKAHRAELGLSEAKPSDQIQGLSEMVKRAEKQEEREIQKRAGGGGINRVNALELDDTGKRWSRAVIMGISGTAGFIVVVIMLMYWISNRKTIDPELAQKETRNRMNRYAKLYAPRIKPFGLDEFVKEAEVMKAMLEFLKQEIEELESIAEKERKSGQAQFTTLDKLNRTKRDLAFTDEWDEPITFKMKEGEKIEITCRNRAVKAVEFEIPRK